MDFDDYQSEAKQTDQKPLHDSDEDNIKALLLPLLGLAGETGSLLTHYKRYFRDGEGYNFFQERISEELGDILWNVANIATKANLSLQEVAQKNLLKVRDRWSDQSSDVRGAKLFDESFPLAEQFPRSFEIAVEPGAVRLGKQRVLLRYLGQPFGNELSDNAETDDGYRLHDVFHLAFVSVLGWSPVLRGKAFFDCKRRSDPNVDEIQDGGRAAVIDEAIAALIFVEAKKNGFYEKVETVEYSVLRTIKELSAHLEVSRCTGREWERAILRGFHVWRQLKSNKGGVIRGDLLQRSISFEPVGFEKGDESGLLDEPATGSKITSSVRS